MRLWSWFGWALFYGRAAVWAGLVIVCAAGTPIVRWEEGRLLTGGLEPPAFSLPRKCWWTNPNGALLRSNAEAIANNRCLAALPNPFPGNPIGLQVRSLSRR